MESESEQHEERPVYINFQIDPRLKEALETIIARTRGTQRGTIENLIEAKAIDMGILDKPLAESAAAAESPVPSA